MIDRQKILSMAKQVLGGDYTGNGHWPFFIEELEQYTALAVKTATEEEREACAAEVETLDCAMRCGVGSEVAATLRARGTGGEERGKDLCSWYSGNYGGWHSSCGTAYIFESGGPVENGHKFCHCCGKRLTVTDAKDTNDNS